MKMPTVQIEAHNSFIDLQVLMTERDGMVAENQYRGYYGSAPAYNEDDLRCLAKRMEALKRVELEANNATI